MVEMAEMAHPKMAANFAYCFRPVYYFSRIFGFMSYTIIYDVHGTVQGSKIRVFDILWFIFSIFSQIIPAAFYFQTKRISTVHPAILIQSVGVVTVTRMVFDISSIVMDLCNRNKLIKIVKKFNIFDENVRARIRFFLKKFQI